MRLPKDCSASCKRVVGKENVQPGEVSSAADPAAANLLWLLDFRLDHLLPDDADKYANMKGFFPAAFSCLFANLQFPLANRLDALYIF